MIKPAICYKEEIEKALGKYFYTDEMMFYQGCLDSGLLSVSDSNNGQMYGEKFQFAVLDKKEKLIGYIGYWVDYYSSCAYGFGAFSFDKGNIVVGEELFNLLERLIKTMHRVEFRAVSGNPAIRGYDHFLGMHKDIGKKHVLTDEFKDRAGNYRSTYIYEFIN